MKKVVFILLLLMGSMANAQNLIPDPTFDSLSSCPGQGIPIDNISEHWYAVAGFPGIMHSCAQGLPFGVPQNLFGYEPAQSGGGYGLFLTAGLYDYLGTHLDAPLTVGTTYRISYYYSLGDSSQYSAYPGIDVLLSVEHLDYSFSPGPGRTIIPGDTLNNRNGWKLFTATFVADSAYEYLAVGNFRTSIPNTISDCPTCPYGTAIGLIDNVCLSESGCAATGIADVERKTVNVYPNPTTGHIRIEGLGDWQLYDMNGKALMNGEDGTYDLEGLVPGTYILKGNSRQLIVVF